MVVMGGEAVTRPGVPRNRPATCGVGRRATRPTAMTPSGRAERAT